MTLQSNLLARISSNRALQLSNPDNPEQSANDTARIANAAADAQATFEVETQTLYDDTNPRHVAYAVYGAEIFLKYGGRGISAVINSPDYQAWMEMLKHVALTLGKATFSPKTSSNYTPSTPPTGRPPFDDTNLNDMRMRAPRGSRNLPGDNH